MEKKIYLDKFQTPMGTVRTAATEKGLSIITLPGSSETEFEKMLKKHYEGYHKSAPSKFNRDAEEQVTDYLTGKLKKFTLKLDINGTVFQKKVLKKVALIPYGKTKTYGEIAKSVGSPNAFRAVGSVNAANKLPLVIPCHRVLATNGLGGYAGGLKMKQRLLDMESNKKQITLL